MASTVTVSKDDKNRTYTFRFILIIKVIFRRLKTWLSKDKPQKE
nr:hypothetical protein CQNTEFLM_CQNTEFLM_CDS_0013 [uncultured phage]